MKRFIPTTSITVLIMVVASLMYASTGLAQRPTPTPPGGTDTPTPRPSPTPPGGTATPTPTAPSTGGSKKEKESPPPLEGAVYGYVIDYSSGGAPQAGVAVVLDGGGWQAETVSNSDGYYVFAGLGSGSAVVNLRLPPGTQSVMPDWPVHTGSSEPAQTNIGYYWGDNPPIPVPLMVEPAVTVIGSKPFKLSAQLDNRSGGEATNGVIDVKLPAGVTAVKAVSSHGEVDFTDHRVQNNLESLADGEKVNLVIVATVDEGVDAAGLAGEVIFTYDEQLTPQLVRFTLVAGGREGQTSDSTAAADSTEKPAETEALIPTTGGDSAVSSTAWIGIVLSLLFILGLSVAGFKAFNKRA